MEPEHPLLEADDEFEGVGGHRDNVRFDLATLLADQLALDDAASRAMPISGDAQSRGPSDD